MGTPRLASPHLPTFGGKMCPPHRADRPQVSPPLSEVVQGDTGGRGCGQADELRGGIKHGSHLMAGISTGR